MWKEERERNGCDLPTFFDRRTMIAEESKRERECSDHYPVESRKSRRCNLGSFLGEARRNDETGFIDDLLMYARIKEQC